jgi:hypothetical protein
VATEAAQRVLQQVRHGQRAQLLLHCRRTLSLHTASRVRGFRSSLASCSLLNRHRRRRLCCVPAASCTRARAAAWLSFTDRRWSSLAHCMLEWAALDFQAEERLESS